MGLARAAQRFDALDVVRSHREDEIGLLHDLAGQLARAVRVEVELALDADEQRAVRCGGAVPGAGAGARRPHVVHAARGGLAHRDRLRRARCDRCCPVQTNSTRTLVVSDEVGHALAEHRGRDGAGTNDPQPLRRAIHDGRRRRRLQRAAVEQPDRAARDLGAPRREDVARAHRRRQAGPVRARRGQRIAHRGNEPLQAGVRRPAHGDAALGSPEPRRHAPLAAAQHQRERARARTARRGCDAERDSCSPSRSIIALLGDEQEERLAGAGGPSAPRARSTDVAVDGAAEAVDGLRWIREHAAVLRGARWRSRRSPPRSRPATRTVRRARPSSFREREERLGAGEVALLGDLQRALAAAHHDHRLANALHQRRVVGGVVAAILGGAMRAHDHVARESLRRLRAPQSPRVRPSSRSRRRRPLP